MNCPEIECLKPAQMSRLLSALTRVRYTANDIIYYPNMGYDKVILIERGTVLVDWISSTDCEGINPSESFDKHLGIIRPKQRGSMTEETFIRHIKGLDTGDDEERETPVHHIGNELNISESQISRIYKKALEKIKLAIEKSSS